MHDPHDDRWERGWRKFERMAQRFGRQAGGFGRSFDGLGENFRIGRMLASGDLRLVALFFIEQQSRHGYDLIKAIEDRSQGFYSPSPGIVYPALTFLEEAGYVSSLAEGNKKLYTITEEGRAHLADNREAIQSTLDFLGKAGEKMKEMREAMREGFRFDPGPHKDHGPGYGPGPGGPRAGPHWRGHRSGPDRDMRDVIPEVNEAGRELKAALAEAAGFRPEDQHKVADALRRAAEEVRRAGHRPEDEVDL